MLHKKFESLICAILNWEKFLFILTSYQLYPKSQAYESIFYIFKVYANK